MREALPETQRPSYVSVIGYAMENHLLIRKKRPHSLTKTNFHAPQNDDLVRRDFTASAPGTKYISDMTEIKCADGKLYLAAILDCFDGAVVGYAMRPHMRASLCCDAFRHAVSRYGYEPGLILHSDHGSQYTSREYRALLTQYGSIRQSMGRTHCCFDNARMESFFATLKKELIYRLHCVSMKRDQVRADDLPLDRNILQSSPTQHCQRGSSASAGQAETVAVSTNAGGITGHVGCAVFLTIPSSSES